jgi:hypothetical protein
MSIERIPQRDDAVGEADLTIVESANVVEVCRVHSEVDCVVVDEVRRIQATGVVRFEELGVSRVGDVVGIGNTARVLAPSQRMSIERIPQRALYGPSL